jgi:hypothetical protein
MGCWGSSDGGWSSATAADSNGSPRRTADPGNTGFGCNRTGIDGRRDETERRTPLLRFEIDGPMKANEDAGTNATTTAGRTEDGSDELPNWIRLEKNLGERSGLLARDRRVGTEDDAPRNEAAGTKARKDLGGLRRAMSEVDDGDVVDALRSEGDELVDRARGGDRRAARPEHQRAGFAENRFFVEQKDMDRHRHLGSRSYRNVNASAARANGSHAEQEDDRPRPRYSPPDSHEWRNWHTHRI